MISISLSPNTEPDDIMLAFKTLFCPWKWKRGFAVQEFERRFAAYLGVSRAVSFNSGRSSLLALLSSLGFKKGDEVLLQAFTCNAVPNPVLWAGLKPLFVDCKDDYNMDIADLEKKITSRSRAVILQHTFGVPADIEKVQEICKRNNLALLEDCAHALGADYKGGKVGTFGDASFFSFSRDKIISCVYGGMVATNNANIAEKIRAYQETIGYPSFAWIFQQLLHPLVMNWIILPTYGFLGKYLLVAFQKLHILSKAVHQKEKRGEKPEYFPRSLPNALAELALVQFSKLERFNAHRKEIANLYIRELQATSYKLQATSSAGSVFLRFPVTHLNARDIIKRAWAENLLLGDWYTSPIAPYDTNAEKVGYKKGSCPVAEDLSQKTLNLPTHIRVTERDARRVVSFLRDHA